ncbi:hypothetical protein CDD80_5103 [Ophiocordyceps camponoti-rufipedis]|uniref:Uncharacterized protein n=1 Tax=Ophiocordyceps camponoti-rufipedis TaxID=2004952 RepID=A0A2C5YVT1_9HYPO|nr:hypothetical protein CDD80_5103 [Ophiocordyceps camponoti-rufipedis]
MAPAASNPSASPSPGNNINKNNSAMPSSSPPAAVHDQPWPAMSPPATPDSIWPLKPTAKPAQYPRYEPPSAVGSPPDRQGHRPFRTASVCSDTTLAHPKPILDGSGSPRGGSVAQLEATAERLSMTSSIDDAIRSLLGELKASDSRRSSMLQRITNDDADDQPRRHLSTSSSILSTNNAARHGGYSPAAFVMSPNHSLSSRRRSDLDLSRHGPGKSSVHSAGMSLAEISESEPISLTQALDEADAAPPIDGGKTLMPSSGDQQANLETCHDDGGGGDAPAPLSVQHDAEPRNDTRPPSSHSTSTFQQCRDAFKDFDGVHWDPDQANQLHLPGENPRPAPPAGYSRPQAYVDAETGQDMMFYPARVPAMLNVPPRLSNKVKAAQRNQRVSEVLSAMFEPEGTPSPAQSPARASTDPEPCAWLAEPVSSPPRSLILDLSCLDGGDADLSKPDDWLALRPPQERDKHRSKLPPQLRASAFFDLPSKTADVEIKDGSAMATLDSLLDASATAPVGAFTDQTFAEVFGKKKKLKKSGPALSPEAKPKKKPSLMWMGRRSGSQDGESKSFLPSIKGVGDGLDDGMSIREGTEQGAVSGGEAAEDDGEGEGEGEEVEGEKDDDEEEDNVFQGMPTTLLAELQLRKQEQKQRTKNFGSGFPNGIHATLLEMDAVAETQRKNRQMKRVNLAWEEPGAHADQNGSDDEDVPLAILAAMHQGAKNMADLERPMGLMERREMEDNEPLSRRRARLQGLDTMPPGLRRPQSAMSLGNLSAIHRRSPGSWAGGGSPLRHGQSQQRDNEEQAQRHQEQQAGQEQEEQEGDQAVETLSERRRRLASGSDADHVPETRPLSANSFSAELLGQFGQVPASPPSPKPPRTQPTAECEETLGQRRRRLQAEREARNREMSHGNGTTGRPSTRHSRPLSMASVLSAHPRKETTEDAAAEEARRYHELRQREAKLAMSRMQMPRCLTAPGGGERSGGFRGGIYNDGSGGCGPMASRSSLVLGTSQGAGYGMGANAALSHHGQYHGQYYAHPHHIGYGYGPPTPASQPMYMDVMMTPRSVGVGASMDRVEQWRRGVGP